jgi:hypothetical protein
MKNETHARIKINQLLTEAGWMFYDNENSEGNILFENHIMIEGIIRKNIGPGNWEQVVSHIQEEIFDKPEEYFNLEIPAA